MHVRQSANDRHGMHAMHAMHVMPTIHAIHAIYVPCMPSVLQCHACHARHACHNAEKGRATRAPQSTRPRPQAIHAALLVPAGLRSSHRCPDPAEHTAFNTARELPQTFLQERANTAGGLLQRGFEVSELGRQQAAHVGVCSIEPPHHRHRAAAFKDQCHMRQACELVAQIEAQFEW